MIEKLEARDRETCHNLVQRIVSSSYLRKSSRLTEMLIYLSERVLDDAVTDIHELEVGCKVFGRPAHYDTGADNIVRVHASMLRKRLREYFQAEGRLEPVIIDIPRGNYAPLFRSREETPPPFVLPEAHATVERPPAPEVSVATAAPAWRSKPIWVPTALAIFFAALSVFLFIRPSLHNAEAMTQPKAVDNATVRQFWSQIFRPEASAQIVMDDAAVDFYQLATDHTIPLSEYFDRSYLRTVKDDASAAKLSPALLESLILRRQSNYADTSLVWKLAQTAGMLKSNADMRFARDLSFSQLKSGNVILLGNRQSNPWIQLFESQLAFRWRFDAAQNASYPEDELSSAGDRDKFRLNAGSGKTHEGYTTVSFLPNLTGTGNVLIITGTGGTAVASGLDFLSDEHSLGELRSRIGVKRGGDFPPFEMLLKIEKGAGLPRDTTIVTCRTLIMGSNHATPVLQDTHTVSLRK